MVAEPDPSRSGPRLLGGCPVAGAYLGLAEGGLDHDAAVAEAFPIAVRLEGHADNAAASCHGGVVVTAGGRLVGNS